MVYSSSNPRHLENLSMILRAATYIEVRPSGLVVRRDQKLGSNSGWQCWSAYIFCWPPSSKENQLGW